MKRMIRSVRPILGKALVLYAFALTVVGDTSAAHNSQGSGGDEQQGRHQNELTFAQIDFPGALATLAFDLNDRGQIVGSLGDAEGVTHGFLLGNGEFTQIDLPVGETNAFGINDRGQIVGLFFDGQPPWPTAISWIMAPSPRSISLGLWKPKRKRSIIAARSWAFSWIPSRGFIGISWTMVCSPRLYSREKLRGPFQKAVRFPLGSTIAARSWVNSRMPQAPFMAFSWLMAPLRRSISLAP
jgi:uncharacterized membrane protein